LHRAKWSGWSGAFRARFVVESGLDNGIEVTDGTDCEVGQCEVRNLRRLGIRITGGSKHRVLSCDIHHTGQGGLVLSGGDRKTLVPADHEAINNHIWRFSEHQLTSAYGLSFERVGNRATHSLIHDAPHQAVFVGGNDHVFEFNEVHHVCTETDDGDGGDAVFGNVFFRCGEPGKGPFGTVFSHGGHGSHAENNIFVDLQARPGFGAVGRRPVAGHAPWRPGNWQLEPGANWSTADDPGFLDAGKGDYRLRPDAAVYQQLPGFKPVPFEKMGRVSASAAEPAKVTDPGPPDGQRRQVHPASGRIQ
jgi:hypothetical protein